MGILEGLIGGFGQSFAEHQKEERRRTAEQGELEQKIFGLLAGSDDPNVQDIAVQAMLNTAGGQRGRKKGLRGFLGETEPSPALKNLTGFLRQRTSAAMPESTMVENTEAEPMGGTTIPTQTTTAMPARVPPPLFRTPEERRLEMGRRERADIMGELGDVPRETQLAAAYGVRPQPAQRLVTVPRYGSVVDPTTGDLLYQDPREPAASTTGRYRTVGRDLYDVETGQVVHRAPPSERQDIPRDRPEYLNAIAALKQIDAALKGKYGETRLARIQPGMRDWEGVLRDREELARQFGFQTYADAQRQAASPRSEPMSMPPSAGGPDMGIMGQGPEVDEQRAAEIVDAQRRGTPPSPQDQAFIAEYLRRYNPQ